MVTGFDILSHDKSLRTHWKLRAVAFIADALMIFIPLPLLLYLFDITDYFTVGLVLSVGFYIFTSITETLTGASVGKKLLGLKVHPMAGESLGGRVCVRNLDRLFWFVLPPLNFALGMAMRGDPRQTALDRIAGTVVIHAGEKERYEAHIEALKEAAGKTASANRDTCQECGGELILLPDQKLQCGKCGLIQ